MTINKNEPYLRIERRFQVSPETVFETLTDPDLMPIWWGDDAEFDIDLRVDGQWTIIRREGGEECLAKGTYFDIAAELRDLVPGERSATEVGWQQGFDLMAAAWSNPA